MFLFRVVLGSSVIVAFASGLQHVVDDADSKVRGATLEPLSQCPPTTSRSFHHDGLHKDRRAEATFRFVPPRDGCYLIEERTELDAIPWNHHDLKKCEASANTKVHVHYCKGLQAVGTVDQKPKGFGRQPQDQWTFIATLQFYEGIPGNITLSNEGTEPGTLTVFDQVRFSWTGKDCFETHAHPRRIEIRMTVDFQHVADRLTIFGIALKKRLAEMAGVSENSLRLTGIRSGSIIAEFLVLPSVVDDAGSATHSTDGTPDVGSAKQSIELLRSAVSKNVVELCAISGGPMDGTCTVELKDLGFAIPSVKPLVVPEAVPVSESVPEQRMQEQQQETQADGTSQKKNLIIALWTVSATCLLFSVFYCLYMSRKLKKNSSTQPYEIKVQSLEVSVEESNIVEGKPVEEDDDKSTVCPSFEPSLNGDIETASVPEAGMSVVKAASVTTVMSGKSAA